MNKVDIQRYGKWYATIHAEIVQLFGTDADLFIDLLAATSPRCQVKRNWRLAKRVYDDYKAGRDIDLTSIMQSHRPNVERALRREPLSGPKVTAFAENLRGNGDHVTVDVWVCRAYGVDVHNFDYKDIENDIRDKARQYGILPCEYQAALWQIERQKEGRKTVSFMAAVAEQAQLTLWED